MTAYLWMLKACHTTALNWRRLSSEEEENMAFNSIVMKFKIDKEAKDKPVVSRVSKDGGKL